MNTIRNSLLGISVSAEILAHQHAQRNSNEASSGLHVLVLRHEGPLS